MSPRPAAEADRTISWPWWIAALTSAAVLGLLATNRGFYNADELDLLENPVPWWMWQWFGLEPALFYRPLGYALFTVQLHAVDGNPVLVHSISVLHHVANCALLAAVLGRLGLPARPALLAALPCAVPGVAWAAAVYDRSALTMLLVVTLLLTAKRFLPFLAVAVFALALVTKETSVGFVVPAALLAWRRRHDANRGFVFAAIGAIGVMAFAFAAWRLAVAPRVTEYAVALDRGAVLRWMRLVTFPFAPTAMDPATVWGTEWLGAIPGLAFLVIAMRGSSRWTVTGLATAAAAIAPIALLPKVEGHYLYLATPGLLLLVTAALRDTAFWSRIALTALLLLTLAHSLRIAHDYRVMGSAMTALQAAHRAAPPDDPLLVHARAWRGALVAARYAFHVTACKLAPPVQIVAAPLGGTWIVADDGSVQRAQ